jgi:sulfur transfer protein SufE
MVLLRAAASSQIAAPHHSISRTPPAALSSPPDDALPRNLRRLSAVLRAAPTERERTLRLLRLGERLPPPEGGAAALLLAEGTRVRGCTSVVHVRAHLADGALRVGGTADSRVARGIVALLARGLHGAPPAALAALSSRGLAEASGLHTTLAAGRLNGVDNMLRTMREQLEAAAAAPPAAAASPATAAAASAEPAAESSWRPSAAADEEVAVLLSGGVDSSVALQQLVAAGHKCRAFYLRIWLEEEQTHAARGDCPWEEDWAYCTAVCEQLGVPLEAVSLQNECAARAIRRNSAQFSEALPVPSTGTRRRSSRTCCRRRRRGGRPTPTSSATRASSLASSTTASAATLPPSPPATTRAPRASRRRCAPPAARSASASPCNCSAPSTLTRTRRTSSRSSASPRSRTRSSRSAGTRRPTCARSPSGTGCRR